MATIPKAFALAIQHHQAGRLEAAEQIYRQILAVEPNRADAWHLLGMAQFQRGSYQAALDSIVRAIGLNPNACAFHGNLGKVYRALKKPNEAAACYQNVLKLNPDDAEAHNNLGIVFKGQGRLDEAIVCYRRALELNPNSVEIYNNLGNVLTDQGNRDEAVACYRRALQLKPDLVATHYNLGTALRAQGKWNEAIDCYRRALQLKPDYFEAHYNLGGILKEHGRLDDAATCFRRAMQVDPNNVEACNNLGIVLHEQQKWNEAVACHRRALELAPDFAVVHNNLAASLQAQGKPNEAVAYFRRTVELNNEYFAAMSALVLELQQLCRWDEVQGFSDRVTKSIDQAAENQVEYPVPPFNCLALPTVTTPYQQLRCAQQWVARRPHLPLDAKQAPALRRPAKPKENLRIGYLSADFRTHPVAMLSVELFEKHDRTRFSIFGYSYGPDDGSLLRRRLVNAFDRFADLQDASLLKAAERIAADEVDILVDLTGYTMNARTEILALRPAPIQVNYLGYPGTMGADFMDYILVDDFIVPPDQQPFFSEKLVHLPGCYLVNDSQREIAPRTPSRAECGLPETGFVYCCFNNNYKITRELFSVWMRLLNAVPGSALWLLEGNRWAPANLRREAEARGVVADRLVFALRSSPAEHLARHRLADLFLDTLPYNAHTTASDSLWVGCPLLTIAGETFASRVAGSLLRAVGLPELITTNIAEYEALALRLATNPAQLAELRARLAVNRATSPLFDGGRFAAAIERAYTTMWQRYAGGEKPTGFRVSTN